jgi:hypothetical protein
MWNLGKDVPGGRMRVVINSRGEASRLLNTLEVRLCRESTERHNFWRFCRAPLIGHRASIRSAPRRDLFIWFCEKRSVREKTLTELLNTLLDQQHMLEQEVAKRALASLRGVEETETFEVRIAEAQGGGRLVQGMQQTNTWVKC